MRKLRCKARAVADSHELGYASTGTEQIGMKVELLDGEFANNTVTWYGYFSSAAEERTLESLKIAGWTGDDIINLPGLGSAEFELQLEEHEDKETGEPYLKPTFINRIGVAMKNTMDASQKAAFAARMRAVTGRAQSAPRPNGNARPTPSRSTHSGYDDGAPPPSDSDF